MDLKSPLSLFLSIFFSPDHRCSTAAAEKKHLESKNNVILRRAVKGREVETGPLVSLFRGGFLAP